MNKKGVLLALVMTALLGVAAWWLTRPAGTDTARPPGPLLPMVDPTAVQSVTVSWGERRGLVLRPDASVDAWMMSENGTQAPWSWPVEAETVRGAIRLLCAAEAVQASGAVIRPGGATVSLDLPGGAKIVVACSADALAGRAAAKVTRADGVSEEVLIPESVARLFEARAIESWRTRRALPLAAGPSRIRILGSSSSCELSRAGGTWGVVEPGLGRADEPAIADLLARLAGLEFERFSEGADGAADTGLTGDAPEIRVEADRRAIQGETVDRRTVVQAIRVGGRADLSGAGVFLEARGAEVRTPGGETLAAWGPVVGVGDAKKLAAISADPLMYLDRRAVWAPMADVTGVAFLSEDPGAVGAVVMISREAQGWRWSHAGGEASPMPLEDVRPLEALLRLLCETRADTVARADGASPAGPVVRIEVQRREAAGPQRVALTIGGPDAARWLAVTSEGLERRYPAAALAPLWSWSQDQLKPAR